jgi:hypothetical protein
VQQWFVRCTAIPEHTTPNPPLCQPCTLNVITLHITFDPKFVAGALLFSDVAPAATSVPLWLTSKRHSLCCLSFYCFYRVDCVPVPCHCLTLLSACSSDGARLTGPRSSKSLPLMLNLPAASPVLLQGALHPFVPGNAFSYAPSAVHGTRLSISARASTPTHPELARCFTFIPAGCAASLCPRQRLFLLSFSSSHGARLTGPRSSNCYHT